MPFKAGSLRLGSKARQICISKGKKLDSRTCRWPTPWLIVCRVPAHHDRFRSQAAGRQIFEGYRLRRAADSALPGLRRLAAVYEI
jgi:hypothetical protein